MLVPVSERKKKKKSNKVITYIVGSMSQESYEMLPRLKTSEPGHDGINASVITGIIILMFYYSLIYPHLTFQLI